MKYQIEDTVSQFNDICDFKLTSPCTQYLWDINNEAEFFDYVRVDLFHLLASKLIYITKSKILDIEPSVALLNTRVAKSNADSLKKLRRYISHLNQTEYDVRIIGVLNIIDLFT